MNTGALKTLFHLFESGLLPLPDKDARVLSIGATADFRPPDNFAGELFLIQGFRPDFLALQELGHRVFPRAEGKGYDLALVMSGRHRGKNELRIADALERTVEGALIVVGGSKEDGIASLAKRLSKLMPLGGQAPKYHGLAFWFRTPSDQQAIAAALRKANAADPIDDRFETAPGMFSHDRIDPGSKLLAETLPADLSGKVADFCAGWGYLSAELLARCAHVSSIDLYEADFASIEAARRNLAQARVATRFFWKDLLTEPVEARYDVIVMNPPFHRGRAAEPEIGQKLIATAAKALASRGLLYLVANRNLPYERALAASFAEHRQIAGDHAFKVFAARR